MKIILPSYLEDYTQQLIDVLTPNMFDGMKSIYEKLKLYFQHKQIKVF